MSTPQCVQRDERTVLVENVSYRWAYVLLTYALLIDVTCRAWFRHEAAWDLMALVVVAGIGTAVYHARQKILTQGWVLKIVLVCCVAVVIAFLAAMTVPALR